MIRIFIFSLLIASFASGQSKDFTFDHVEPAFWWVGMKNTSVQVLLYKSNADLRSYRPSLRYAGVTIKEIKTVENPHYLFVTLEIAPATKAGHVSIQFKNDRDSFIYNYEIKKKSTDKNRIQGFSSADAIYLIMPDRFANGDEKNDSIPGMYEAAHREQPYGRHGGDLKGISDHLNYIKELGVTTVWLNPVLENNQRAASYHGYAITDLYRVDRRFGTNDDYLALINNCHKNGLKVLQDMVMNHIGSEHWLFLDLPERNWVHQFPEFMRTNYKAEVISDPYQAEDEATIMSNGWFDHTMPDVNQENSLFATYLIQNTLWWIEYAGIDGIRMDTYPYPDKNFMSRWAKEILTEYPAFNIVGEVWMRNVNPVAYWQKDAVNNDGYNSYLPSVTDFPFYYNLMQALNEQGNWNSGLTKIYDLLSQDSAYPNANANLIFVDNHDLTRYYTSVGHNLNTFKMGLALLLTTRGVPEIYYGTELLMEGDERSHAELRKDFPGGWKRDVVNAFTKEGRTKEQNEAYDFLKKVLNWRKNEKVIQTGKLTHYIVNDNIYVYFRHDANDTVMIIINGNQIEKELDTKRFQKNIVNAKSGVNVLTDEEIKDLSKLHLPSRSALIIKLKQ
jgi:glycosidase